MKLINWARTNFKIAELLKFIVGGGSAVVIDAVVYAILKIRINVSLSKMISYVAGAAVGFVINKHWTFQSQKFKVAEVVKYVLLYGISAIANAFINKIVLWITSNMILAFFCATGISTVINFLGQKFVVFKKEHDS